MTKKIIIIAGPNGAGKTTFARSFLPQEAQCPRFINADLIAAGLSPFAPEAAALMAGRLMLAESDECVRRGDSFAFETTLAGLAYVGRVEKWRREGYHVSRRRFAAGLRNLEHIYKSAVDTWAEFDNVGQEPTLLQWGENR